MISTTRDNAERIAQQIIERGLKGSTGQALFIDARNIADIVESGLLSALDAERLKAEHWRIECERLANGLLESHEDEADASAAGVIAPENAVDAAFALVDALTTQRDAERPKVAEAEQQLAAMKGTP